MDSTIEFLLGDELLRIDFQNPRGPQPTTTVLNYLRSLPNFNGTKEGCAEGDCGACTVVLAEVGAEGTLHYKSADSCLLFLPMLHGRQLITVENLKQSDGLLHPVQQAMVDSHGSQCGFCTPGFVMSMFALTKNSPNATGEQIADALTGNLCRCTGYRPIVEAAAKSCATGNIDRFTNLEPQSVKQLSAIPHASVQVATNAQKYFLPVSLAEALKLKREYPNATVIGGATDVALRVTKRHELIPEILDLGAVNELRIINETDQALTLGAAVSLERMKSAARGKFPALHEMLAVFGSQQIRNLATLGGNLGSASPIGDTLPVLMAYYARVVLQSVDGMREVAMNDYVTGYRQTLRKPDELIVAVVLPKISNGAIVKSYKISKRRDLDIATVSGGFRLERTADGIVNAIKLVYGGMADRPKRAAKTEVFLAGKQWNRETIQEAMSIVETEFSPISDARSGAEFRTIAARNLLLKFWSETTTQK
jgi:xanthine dehydrogenase small subunit